MVNQIIFQGRFTKDPEVKKTQSDISYVHFTIAWSEKYKENETQCFLDCTAWRGTADMIGKYFSKGKECVIEGRLRTDKYTDKDGNNRSKISCDVNRIHFTSGSRNSGSDSNADNNSNNSAEVSTDFMDVPELNTDKIPF